MDNATINQMIGDSANRTVIALISKIILSRKTKIYAQQDDVV